MALIGYARVSTQDQNLEAQIEQLTKEGCDEIFHGKQSGKSAENLAKLREMVNYCRKGDIVLVTKFDRLGRSLNQILETVQKLQSKGVMVRTLDGHVDTTNDTPMAKAFTQLLGVFAELEHGMITDRLQSGRQRTGRLGGRPSKLTPDQRQTIKHRHAQGESQTFLAKEYGVSRATIINIVKAA